MLPRVVLIASMPRTELIFGIHAVLAVLHNDPANIQVLRVDRARRDARMRELRALATSLHISLREVDAKALNRQAPGNRHQGVIALYRSAPTLNEDALAILLAHSERPLLLVLDGITDPHNLGACLRTAEAAGVTVVIAPRDRAARINATVRKVACGAAERVALVQVTNLARALRGLKEKGLWLIGTDDKAIQPLYDLDLTRPLALLMGAEGKGLRRMTRELCDALVHIPMAGAAQSLNVSVAAGVCLFEAQRQRRR
jgi:23S rRNA (guanosine2251-2'-O)-methyltransferase